MQDSSVHGEYRQLRAITIISFFLGFSLLVPYGVASGRALPAICIVPLFFSAGSGAMILTGRLQFVSTKALLDISLATFYVVLLIPSWIELSHRSNMRWVNGGETMLGSYGTAVVMLCFMIHLYVGLEAVRSGDLEMPTINIVWNSSSCSGCEQHSLHHRSVSVAGHRIEFPGNGSIFPHEHGTKDIRQPFIQARVDDDNNEEARESSEYATSGFNSPRRSAETLATDFHHDADV